MKGILLFIISLSFTVSYFSQELLFNDGLYTERPIHSDTSMYKYSKDNITYKPNLVFVYDYYFIDSTGSKKKFLATNNTASVDNSMNLISLINKCDSAIDKITLTITDWKAFRDGINKFDSLYTQTICSYSFVTKKPKPKSPLEFGKGTTGIIDNKKNIWIHPPRDYGFKILQLNPYPLYYLDETVKTWTWTLSTGRDYLDSRWINWAEDVDVVIQYYRGKDEVIETSLGKINCKVTNSMGTIKLGYSTLKTYLKSFYNPKYGFIRLEYTNVNRTELVLQLVELKE